MSAAEVIEQIKALPMRQKKEVFVYLTREVCLGNDNEMDAGKWLGKQMTFEDACDVVFRENRELLGLLAK